MKLIDEIVGLLSRQDGSLTDALLKTKVLMRTLGQNELAQWVDDELTGYDDDKEVPPYRIVRARLMGTLVNSAWRHANQMLPTNHLPEDIQKQMSEGRMYEPIRVLEQYAAKASGSLQLPISSEFTRTYSKTAVHDGWVESMWSQIEFSQVTSLLIEVRSKLLDFILGLRDKLGDDVGDSNPKDVGKGVDVQSMFQNAVIGAGATFVVGSHNTTSVSNVVNGDFSALAKALTDSGVDPEDIRDLEAAVAADDRALVVQEKKFGAKVKAWMGKMSIKAIDGVWKVGIAAGGKLLADGLSNYYGI